MSKNFSFISPLTNGTDVALMECSDFMQQLRSFKPQSLGSIVARRKSSTTLIFPLPPQACSGKNFLLPRLAPSFSRLKLITISHKLSQEKLKKLANEKRNSSVPLDLGRRENKYFDGVGEKVFFSLLFSTKVGSTN